MYCTELYKTLEHMDTYMNISVSEAAKQWGVSRTTIYKKIDDGELSRNAEKKIDTTEMLRVFGNPPNKKRTEQINRNVQKTLVNSEPVQENVHLKHQLEMEKLKNNHLLQQVDHQKQLIENYQKQIEQLSKSLDKANASIQDFAQTKLLEMKSSLSIDSEEQTGKPTYNHQTETTSEFKPHIEPEKKYSETKRGWWPWGK